MSCREYSSGLLELARDGALDARERQALLVHVEHCAECAGRLDEQRAMQRALQRLAPDELAVEDEIEARVLAEFDRAAGLRRTARSSAARWVLAAGLAASVSLGAYWTLRRSPAAAPAVTAASEEAEFLTIPYTIPLAPEERAEVVRMRIPVTALLAAGFRVPVSDPSAAIDAEVLVSQDGRARAIRSLTVAIYN
jgi:anti-sigma factor RsiW